MVSIIDRWATGRIRSTETRQGMNILHKQGGWSTVTFEKGGRFVKMNLRTNLVNAELKKGHMRFNKAADRLYSQWTQNTRAGQLFTARRQVEGMLKKAIKDGNTKLADELRAVLSGSDASVAKYRKDWEDKHSDLEIEQFYNYGPESDIEALIANL